MLQADPKLTPPTAQTESGDEDMDLKGWLAKARSAFRSSTNYFDSNVRRGLEDSIRAFNNQHPGESKYNSPAYDKRSKLFRPKIRSVIRKNEAAAAAAFFSNMDVVDIEGMDQQDKSQVVSADLMKQILQYRLKKSIPWFQVVMGGIQDAQTSGAVIGHVYWDYEKAEDEEKPTKDKPCVDLIPLENFRFDMSASWIDPINTSPFIIHLMPMYAMDVKARQRSEEWLSIDISGSGSGMSDSTRVTRMANKEDPLSSDAQAIDDYEIIWVQRHIHRMDGKDVEFFTLGEKAMLSEPRPLTDAVFHGKRPYVLGCCILESHKPLPTGVPTLARGLEDEINEVANQRIDNVKFALNKKWFAKRGVEVDLAGLVRNVPGGVVMMNDPDKDVREVTWPDVTQSSYAEQQGLDMSMDELLGNFNPAALMTQGAGNAPARNMAMLNQSNGTLVEYLIRTFVVTFVEPVLRQLILLEQEYETDMVILGIAKRNAPMMQKFGMDEVTDELLRQEITLNVNVGMGATDPSQKLSKFLSGMNSFSAMMKSPVPGLNMVEVGKEIFSHLGYQDGSRFFTNENPQVVQLQQQLQQAAAQIQQLSAQLQEKQTAHMVGLQKTKMTNDAKILTTRIQEDNENKRNFATHITAIHNIEKKDKANGQRRTSPKS